MLFIFSELHEHFYTAVLARKVLSAKLAVFFMCICLHFIFLDTEKECLICNKGTKMLKSYTKKGLKDNKYKFSDRTSLVRMAVYDFSVFVFL